MSLQPKPYKPERDVFCGDGREPQLLAFVKSHPKFPSMQNNPSEVLAAIDEFGHQNEFLMNVGQSKGEIVSQAIANIRPKTMVELGGYVGYSAIMFGDALRKAGGEKYISLELNPEFASVASSLLSIAGLGSFVEIITGPCATSLRKLRDVDPAFSIDILFLDHQKSAYVEDLALCEELSLIRPGSTVIADNVISPGAPNYLSYIRGTRAERLELLKSLGIKTDSWSSAKHQLNFQSKLYNGFEPTGEPDGVEISLCE
ncbi:unnamed protein product [Clonostachys rosea]|uniref:catechol O-methyltransferase n=1 Tax=Bionectria ochroleuca TaxID=29856 RepID=A0ABY6V250_BIOOC|nr:unnamed protein product [Clonostachys rosea]